MFQIWTRMAVRLSLLVLMAGLVAVPASAVQAASHGSVPRVVLLAGGNGSTNVPNSNSKGAGHGNNVPETPYAILFPIAIAGVVWLVYKRRRSLA